MLDASEILNASILVVDDMDANVMLLEQMLRNAGYANITTTQNPRAVLGLYREQLRAERPRLPEPALLVQREGPRHQRAGILGGVRGIVRKRGA